MCLCMAVCAQQTALGDFGGQNITTPVRHGTQVQLEALLRWVEMMPSQGCVVLAIAATLTAPAASGDKRKFPAQSPRLLAEVVLMTVVGIAVLALKAAELALPALEYPPAGLATTLPERFLLHI